MRQHDDDADDHRPDMPEALTVLGAGMAQMHEFYRAALDAGFTERQAMQLLIETIRNAGNTP